MNFEAEDQKSIHEDEVVEIKKTSLELKYGETLKSHQIIENIKILESYNSILNTKKDKDKNAFKRFYNGLNQISFEMKELIFQTQKIAHIEDDILFSLKEISGFNKFLHFNNIDDDSLRLAIKYFKYLYVSKGTYIFKQLEKSQLFFGVIKGLVSIRVLSKLRKKNKTIGEIVDLLKIDKNNNRANFLNLANNNSLMKNVDQRKIGLRKANNLGKNVKLPVTSQQEETEKALLKEGMCFGEWGLLYNKERSASAIAIEDTDLFTLNKEYFDISFAKCIIKAETERKNLIISSFQFFKDIPTFRFDEIYKKFSPKFFLKNDLIYNQGDTGDKIFLIYKGECKLQKTMKNKNKNEETNIETEINPTLINMTRGDIGGLEIIIDPACIYKHSLISTSSSTIVFSIEVDTFCDYHKEMTNLCKKILNQREVILEESIHRNITLNNKLKITSANENFETKLKNNINEENQRIKKEIETKKGEKNVFKNANLKYNFEGIKNIENFKHYNVISHEKTKNNRSSNSYDIFKTQISIKINSKIKDSKTVKKRYKGDEFDYYLYSKTNFGLKKNNLSPSSPDMILNTHNSRNLKYSLKPYETNANIWKKTVNTDFKLYNTGQFNLPLFFKISKTNH